MKVRIYRYAEVTGIKADPGWRGRSVMVMLYFRHAAAAGSAPAISHTTIDTRFLEPAGPLSCVVRDSGHLHA
jgi:hypothetical protein